jgi:hypothetical protein
VVARIRTDSFGSTAIHNSWLAISRDVSSIHPVYPNPIKVSSIGQYFSGIKNVRLYDLQGNPINYTRIKDNGVYVIKIGHNPNLSKITIIK